MVNKKKNKRKFEISGELTWIHVVIFLVLCLVFIRETRFAFGNSEMDDSAFDMGNVGSVLPAGMLNLVNDGVVGGEEGGEENHAAVGDEENIDYVNNNMENNSGEENMRGTKGIGHYTILDQMPDFEREDITVCDPDDINNCITMMDRDLGARLAYTGTSKQETVGYHYQWGNNYGFIIGCDTLYGSCSDDITASSVSDILDFDDNYLGNGYFDNVFHIGKVFSGISSQSIAQIWGGGNDNSGNNYGYDLDNFEDRQGPCPEGYHIPSVGEYSELVKYWAKNYLNVGNTPQYGEDSIIFINGDNIAQLKREYVYWFKLYFHMPSSLLYRDGSNGMITSSTNYYILWLSSIGYNTAFHSSSYDGVAMRIRGGGNDGCYIRCFQNSFFKTGLTVQFRNGSTLETQIVPVGETVTQPIDPIPPVGYQFDGWYIDRSYHGGAPRFDFSRPITADLRLKAAFSQKRYSVTWRNENETYEMWYEYYGNRIYPIDTGNMHKTGYIFAGWYSDKELTRSFNFNDTIVTSDINIYAKWESCPEGYVVVDNECIESKCGNINMQYVDGECRDMKRGTIVNGEGNYECIAEGAVYDNVLQQCVYRTDDFSIMSTNLGVTMDNELGLYYQWGKKYGFDRGYYGYIDEGGNNYNAPLNDVEYELFNSYDIEENMCYIRPEEEDPCPDGFHVPTTDEWNTLFISWCKNSDFCDENLLKESEIPGRYSLGDPEFGGAYQDMVYHFIEDYNLPLAGSRDNGSVYMLGSMGDYWSSEYGVGAVPYYREGYLKSWGFSASLQGGLGPVSFISNFGASVRCFANPESVKVVFKLNIDEGDDTEVFVNKGSILKKSDIPTRDGYIGVWYTDSKLRHKFDLNTPITGDITLYAKRMVVEKGIFYKDGYIKISNGDKTYYIKDRNVGATVSQGVPEIEMKFALIDDKAGKLSNQYGWGSEEYETQLLEYTKELLGIEFDSTDDMRDYLNNPLSYEYYNLLYDKYDEELLSIIENISQENFDDLDTALDYVNHYPYNSEYGNAISNKQRELNIQYNYDYDAYKDILLEYANELIGKTFDNMNDVWDYVNNTLRYDVRYKFYDMYGEDSKLLIESMVDKQFSDLDTALYYVNYYNPYNPEYGEVNINAFGNYYFRGNNNGVKYIDLEFDDIGMITNMETLVQEKGFNGGKIGSDDTGREEGKIDNPCNGENEYFPTPEDWKELLDIRTNINGYNLNRYGESFYDTISYYLDDENGNGSYLVDLQFANDLLIPSAGYIENMGLNDYRNLRTLQDSGGYVGSLFGDDGVGIQYSLVDNVIDNRYGGNGSINNIAMPVRCFLDIEEPENISTYTVKFVTNGGSSINDKEVEEGYKLIQSELVTTRNGYTFVGWYTDRSLTIPYNFSEVVDDDIILYAKWEKIKTSGGTQLKRDNCPGGDYSNSYYDGDCGTNPKDKEGNENDGNNQHNSSEDLVYDTLVFNPHYSDEQNKAYQYAYHYGITTKAPISNANIDGNLTRIAMAKMLSQYAINVLGMKPDTNRNNTFKDVTDKLDGEYDDGVTLAYQLGIMGINMPNNEFRPNDLVPRAEFVTALSRLLYKTPDGIFEETPRYYVPHMEKLIYEGIINNPDPKMLELRGYVMLMLMRSDK